MNMGIILSGGYATRHNCSLVGTLALGEYLNNFSWEAGSE